MTEKLPAKCFLGIYFARIVDVKDVAKKVLRNEGQISEEES